MSLTSLPTSLRAQLNAGNPNTLPSNLQRIAIGSVLGTTPMTLRKKLPVASPYALAAEQVISLPEDAKADTIFRAYARAGTATPVELTVMSPNTTPAAGQIAVAPSGDIAVAAVDAWTSVDVVYLPERYDVVELPDFPVITDTLTLTSVITAAGAVMAIEVEALTGTATGKKIIAPPGTAPAAGEAALSADKLTVAFNAADAVTSARVKLAVGSAIDVQALLEAASTSP